MNAMSLPSVNFSSDSHRDVHLGALPYHGNSNYRDLPGESAAEQ